MHARVSIKRDQVISKIDPRIYGSFLEHLGRAIYTGIYEPGHPKADAEGYRQDVLEAIKALKVPLVRYPGGNFVSGYRWEDGTGPRDLRPQRLELAWGTIETNQIGVDEIHRWAALAGTEVMMAVNLGTRGAEEAGNLVEYCNLDTPTHFAQLRKKNGHPKPFGFKTWCLGNEMDGEWQICRKTAEEYARLAGETAKIMKWTDPSIELVACGSSSKYMPTFGHWEETVLRECWNHVDYISLHSYYGNPENDTATYLAKSLEMEAFIREVAEICAKIKVEKKSDHEVRLSFDEWNVWFHSREQDKKIPRWSIAPPQLEDQYNMEDALVVGCMLNTLIRNADTVKIACLAQLVNVIAPIMTIPGGGLWYQTIFYPFLHASTLGRGVSLRAPVQVSSYAVAACAEVPWVDTSAVLNEEAGLLVVFAVNRHLTEALPLELDLAGFPEARPHEHIALSSPDLKACNSAEDPHRVVPHTGPLVPGAVTLAPLSWNVLTWRIKP